MKAKIQLYKLSLRKRLGRQFEQFKKYCYTSIFSSLLVFVLFFVSTSILHIYYLLSFVVVYIIGVSFSFVINKFYIFNLFTPKRLSKLYFQFFIIDFFAFIGNLMLLYILVDFFNIWYLLAQLFIILVGSPILFMGYKNLVFSHK